MEVAKLLKQNRCGQQPKWSQLGIDFGEDPLHLKNVSPLVYDKALEDPDLQKFRHKKGFDSSIDEMALPLEDPELGCLSADFWISQNSGFFRIFFYFTELNYFDSVKKNSYGIKIV